jgi:hypothetical protein
MGFKHVEELTNNMAYPLFINHMIMDACNEDLKVV